MPIRPLTLADGQVAAAAASIFSGANAPGTKVNILFTNVGGAEETLVVTFTRAGGTARRILRHVLAANESSNIMGLPIQADDTILATTTNAASVDYLVSDGSGDPFEIGSTDSNGGFKSGSSSFAGAITASGAFIASSTGQVTGDLSVGAAAPTNPQAKVAILPQTRTITANQSYFHEQILATGGATTVPAGTAPVVASLNVHEPNITATGTVTDAATVRIVDAPTEGTNNYALWVDAGTTRFDGATVMGGALGSAATVHRLIIPAKACADNTATDLITVTVPNGNHAAAIRITLLGRNAGTDTFESARVAEGAIVLARTTGANVAAAAATLALAQIATVAAGDTFTLAYAVSAITGAVGATNTFTVTVTLDSVGNQACSCMALVELINEAGTGVTVAAA